MGKKSQTKLMEVLNWCYVKAVAGLPGTQSAIELAQDYLSKSKSVDEAINSLISWQQLKTGASGFLTGLGGFATLPVAIPADLAATFYINVRMVAAIAFLRGYDLKSDQTKTLVFLTLVGDSAGEILSKAGVQFGQKLTRSVVSRIPGEVLKKINQAIGFRLATKTGQKGIVNFVKLAPIIGGVIGGGINAYTCRFIGDHAKALLV